MEDRMSSPIFNLSDNRELTPAEVQRCLNLVAAVDRSARESGSLGDESRWVSPDGQKVYGQISGVDFASVDARFLSRLRMEAFMFSGVRLENILGTASVPHWNDNFSEFFLNDDSSDWCVPAFKEYTKGLPPEYVCNPPLVMGEIGYRVGPRCVNRDVVSYQERINLLLEFAEFKRLKELENPLILEIGGGYGGLAYFIKKIVP